MNLGLLSLCRRTAALMIGCGYRLWNRYVESEGERKAADTGFRSSGGDCRPVSTARAASGKPRRSWHPVASSPVKKPPSQDASVPPQAVIAAVPECQTPQRIVPSFPPAQTSQFTKPAPEKPEVPRSRSSQIDASKCRGPRLGSTWAGAPPVCNSADLPRLPRASERLVERATCVARRVKIIFPPLGASSCFAGSCRFSTAMNERDLRLLPPPVIGGGGRAYDLSLPSVQLLMIVWLLTGRVWFCLLAPPCTDFSVCHVVRSLREEEVHHRYLRCALCLGLVQSYCGPDGQLHLIRRVEIHRVESGIRAPAQIVPAKS